MFGKAPTSSCDVSCVSVLCFSHSPAAGASRETENGAQSLRNYLLVAVLVKFASFFGNRGFIVVLTSAPPRAPIFRHWNAHHVLRPVSQNFSHQFLGLPNGVLSLQSGPKLCMNYLRLVHLVPSGNTQED